MTFPPQHRTKLHSTNPIEPKPVNAVPHRQLHHASGHDPKINPNAN
jgi:hypothetical protein